MLEQDTLHFHIPIIYVDYYLLSLLPQYKNRPCGGWLSQNHTSDSPSILEPGHVDWGVDASSLHLVAAMM